MLGTSWYYRYFIVLYRNDTVYIIVVIIFIDDQNITPI